MGSFYTNVTLHGVEQEQVAEYLAGRNRQVLVSPTVHGITVVYDALTEAQELRLLTNLARELSAQFECPALAALNHDDDVLWLQLSVEGRLVDEYTSSPGYFSGQPSETPEGGDAEALCDAFSAEGADQRVDRLLRREQDMAGYFPASERHGELAEALGIPSELVITGYRYLTHGETPAGFLPQDFIHTGQVPRTVGLHSQGQWGPGVGQRPQAPGQDEMPPGSGHIHIGPAPGPGCCGCLLAPLMLPLGLLLSAWSAWALRRQAGAPRTGGPPTD